MVNAGRLRLPRSPSLRSRFHRSLLAVVDRALLA
jgi:hypothetical protein